MTRKVIRLVLAGALAVGFVAPSHAAKIIRYGNNRASGMARAQLRAERQQMRAHRGARAVQSDIPPPAKR